MGPENGSNDVRSVRIVDTSLQKDLGKIVLWVRAIWFKSLATKWLAVKASELINLKIRFIEMLWERKSSMAYFIHENRSNDDNDDNEATEY
jgi:hypothetical protein